MSLKRMLIVVLAVVLAGPALVWTRSQAAPDAGWWDAGWTYRVAVNIGAAGVARNDKAADVELNFTELLAGVGEDSRFDPDSIRVVEVGGARVKRAVARW